MKNIIMSLLAMTGLVTSCTAQENVRTVSPREFACLMKQDSTAVLLDVRTMQEYAEGHLKGARNIDYLQTDSFGKAIAALARNHTYYIYCRSGRRSHGAAVRMQGIGLQVVDMKGGYLAWTEAKLPTTTETAETAAAISKSGHAVETFKTDGGKDVRIGLIKHGSLSISYDGYEIQIDPVAAYGKPTDYASMPKAHLILVTHEHADHFDPATIKLLSNDSTQLFLNGRCFEKMQRGTVLHNGDTQTVGRGIRLTAVPAYNTTPEHMQFHPKGIGNGYVLEIDGLRIYVAGDTEDIDEMSQLKDIDVAFLPVNQPYTMTVEQAVRAARIIRPKVFIPYHFGKTDVRLIQEQLRDTDMEVRLRDMQ